MYRLTKIMSIMMAGVFLGFLIQTPFAEPKLQFAYTQDTSWTRGNITGVTYATSPLHGWIGEWTSGAGMAAWYNMGKVLDSESQDLGGGYPQPTFAVTQQFDNTSNAFGVPFVYPSANDTILQISAVVTSDTHLNWGWLSIYYGSLYPGTDPWKTSLGVPIPWHNSTAFAAHTASQGQTQNQFDFTSAYNWTGAMVTSSLLKVMWTQDQNTTHVMIDYVGISYTYMTGGPITPPPTGNNQTSWTPQAFITGNQFLMIIGVMGLCIMVITPFIYVSNKDGDDGRVGAVIQTTVMFFLGLGFFMAWIMI